MANDLTIINETIKPGETKDFNIKISESVLGTTISLPIKVIRSKKEGPVILVLAGIHGDEMNGVGIVRDLMLNPPKLLKGSLVCLPIVNIFGFEENSRYLPDRRDLNRCFPGKKDGTLGARLANLLSKEIIQKCDYVIDLHTGAFPRTNFPQIRADYSNGKTKKLAQAFKASLILDTKGSTSTLRYWATKHGIPTITYEGGETNRFEAKPIKAGLIGIKNVLKAHHMLKGKATLPSFQVVIKKSTWIRTNTGGILQMKVKSGDLVAKGNIIASCLSLNTNEKADIRARHNGIVLGLTTRPTIKPGEPVCNFAHLPADEFNRINKTHNQITAYESRNK